MSRVITRPKCGLGLHELVKDENGWCCADPWCRFGVVAIPERALPRRMRTGASAVRCS